MLYRITKSKFGAVVQRNDFNADVYSDTNVHADADVHADTNSYTDFDSYADTNTHAGNRTANTTIQCTRLHNLGAEAGVAIV